MNGIIIYSPEDVDKNRTFIQMCIDKFKKSKVELYLVILENKSQKRFENIQFQNVDFAINRSRNFYIARQLEEAGIRVFNSSHITEIFNDKWKTYIKVKELNLLVMKTRLGEKNNKRTYPIIVKSCEGHGGNEVFLVNNEDEYMNVVGQFGGNYIEQQIASEKGKDVRIYVIGKRIIKAMCRTSNDSFKSNFSLGGSACEHNLTNEEVEIAEKIIEHFEPDYIGIDIIYDDGIPVLNEIEDAVGARMIYENTDVDIVDEYVAYINEQIKSDKQ